MSCFNDQPPDIEISETHDTVLYTTSELVYLYFPITIASEVKPPERGIAKAYGSLLQGEANKLHLEWYYDYGLRWPPVALDNGAEYVPFFWCDQHPANKWPTVYSYFDALGKLPSGYSGDLLFLNEPDLRGGDVDGWQCDRSPRQAAYIYKAVLSMCPNCRIIGPTPSHIDYLNGWPWLKGFYNEISNLGLRCPDVGAIHDYTQLDPNVLVDSFFETIAEFDCHPTSVWVTEFSSCDSNRTKEAIEFYRSDYRVERWAWFTATGYPASPCYNLIDLSTRELTPNGRVFSSGYP